MPSGTEFLDMIVQFFSDMAWFILPVTIIGFLIGFFKK